MKLLVSGAAATAAPAGGLDAAFHFAGAMQIIDLGPVSILDYGQ